jgi:hypothetical protein
MKRGAFLLAIFALAGSCHESSPEQMPKTIEENNFDRKVKNI